MGLDMYLYRKVFVGWKYEHVREGKNIPDLSEFGIDSKKVEYIFEEAIYWRKDNQIHSWFVTNIQDGRDDCGDYRVSIDELKELYDTICRVLADHTLAKTLLPTMDGFFFGGTDYDEYYWEGLEDTRSKLEEVIKRYDGDGYLYTSSW